ncbi:GPI biosynthesis protein family Pig-F-domain-containing protein [Mycena amicta]|nr:GPI biosynthesis protein family Pig-F-domain-containing protein [Mycena amicta]
MPPKPTTRTSQQPAPPPENPSYFPFAAYSAAVGVHTTLHAFSALFLVQTPGIIELITPNIDPSLVTSRDRPQSAFLDALTRSPAATLVCICVGAVVLQSWWGGWVRAWRIESILQGTGAERKVAKARINARKLAEMRDAWLATTFASGVFFVILILLGAPLNSHLPQTFLFAVLLSLLTTFVPAYTLGSPFSGNNSTFTRLTWSRLFAELSSRSAVERAILYPSVGTVLGSWLGAIPIALDWDRPWQAWPLTLTTGAVAGYILASIAALSASAVHFVADEHLRSLRAEKLKTT